MRHRLDEPPFAGRTGTGVRVAVVDSGVQPAHPHVGRVAGGVAIVVDAALGALRAEEGDFLDRIGHGTAVTAAIHEKAPGAEFLALRVFERRLSTSTPVLARAIEHAAEEGAHLINLSLGTEGTAHLDLLESALERARNRGTRVVAALAVDGRPHYPGSLPGVASVLADPTLARDELVVTREAGRVTFHASPLPRPIPGVPPERNLSGISFAVANVTGFLARALEREHGGTEAWEALVDGLV
jgi:subtilisin family serine protease